MNYFFSFNLQRGTILILITACKNTLTDISNEKISFSKLPDIPKNLSVEQTEVLIKVKNK